MRNSGYDCRHRYLRVILPSGRTYGFGYDHNSNLTHITMSLEGGAHAWHTTINLDNSYIPPSNPAYSAEYNLDRQWKHTTLPSGHPVDAAYDNVSGRFKELVYPEVSVSLGYNDNTDRVNTITRISTPDNVTQQPNSMEREHALTACNLVDRVLRTTKLFDVPKE